MAAFAISAVLPAVRPAAPRASAAKPQGAFAMLRCESGAKCTSSRSSMGHSVALARSTRVPRGGAVIRHALVVRAGPQPETEEEGSALDFPEV